MQRKPGIGAEPYDIAGVRGYFRLIENDVNHAAIAAIGTVFADGWHWRFLGSSLFIGKLTAVSVVVTTGSMYACVVDPRV